jgi:hypothetical protein
MPFVAYLTRREKSIPMPFYKNEVQPAYYEDEFIYSKVG